MTARSLPPFVFATLLALAGASAVAQHGPAPAPKAAPAPAPAPKASVDPETGALVDEAPPVPTKDAKIEHLVTEDSQVKIDETRVRGVTTKIVVHSKVTGGSYEIQPRDPSKPRWEDAGAGMRTFSWGF
ncbi:hypothetical protein [Scleromatobacter humisilvae]|uniref:DUF2782 domain-containing protein n=1 Tax=Scleromatobacter humisilvae TaxID=2897159 RepID=A0A9X2C0X3_9BURK|nr:hypothetical protein [Scleromatobacter humisilvae]MCK9688263.1 hypothetical protein [Scleromatobacter humisilvae]